MKTWIVEYKTTTGHGWQSMEGIKANDGFEAIEYVKRHTVGAYKFKCYIDEEV